MTDKSSSIWDVIYENIKKITSPKNYIKSPENNTSIPETKKFDPTKIPSQSYNPLSPMYGDYFEVDNTPFQIYENKTNNKDDK